MIPRPLTFLLLSLLIATSGCHASGLGGNELRIQPGDRSSAWPSDRNQSQLDHGPVSQPQTPAVASTGAGSIEHVNWSVFEGFEEDQEARSARVVESAGSDSEWRQLCQNLRNFGPTLWEDTQGVVQVENAVVLGVALAAAIGIRQDLDDRVREATEDNPTRWGSASRVLGYLGEPQYQVPVLILLTGHGVRTNDSEFYDFSEALLSAYTINGLATLAIKGITNTDRPDSDWNGGQWGFPSFHAGSAFTIASVVETYHGWGPGLPAYALAGLIGWSRIDQRDHDLSDVVFGAAMGWVIGKSVALRHLTGDGRVAVLPWMHPSEPSLGMALEARF